MFTTFLSCSTIKKPRTARLAHCGLDKTGRTSWHFARLFNTPTFDGPKHVPDRQTPNSSCFPNHMAVSFRCAVVCGPRKKHCPKYVSHYFPLFDILCTSSGTGRSCSPLPRTLGVPIWRTWDGWPSFDEAERSRFLDIHLLLLHGRAFQLWSHGQACFSLTKLRCKLWRNELPSCFVHLFLLLENKNPKQVCNQYFRTSPACLWGSTRVPLKAWIVCCIGMRATLYWLNLHALLLHVVCCRTTGCTTVLTYRLQ